MRFFNSIAVLSLSLAFVPNAEAQEKKTNLKASEPRAEAEDAGISKSPMKDLATVGGIRVACIGDSITEGTYGNAYPDKLGESLGGRYDVRNFGVGAASLLASGAKPYRDQAAFDEALRFRPEIVIIMLGTNDSTADVWKDAENFVVEYTKLIATFKELDTKPAIYVCTPPTVATDNWGIRGRIVATEIRPLIKKLAGDRVKVVDAFAAFEGKRDRMLHSDGVHPNAEGASLIAAILRAALLKGEVLTNKDQGKNANIRAGEPRVEASDDDADKPLEKDSATKKSRAVPQNGRGATKKTVPKAEENQLITGQEELVLTRLGDPRRVLDNHPELMERTTAPDGSMVPTTMRRSTSAGCDIHCGQLTRFLGSVGNTEFLVSLSGASGVALTDQRRVIYVAYIDGKPQPPRIIKPYQNAYGGWSYDQKAVTGGYWLIAKGD